MKFLGNILWIILGGLIIALYYWIVGLLFCITIIGIPIGLQCFKFAALSFSPFGKEIILKGGAVSLLLNIIWIVTSGLPLAIEHATFGVIFCITIIGIPFGKQHFKLAKLALMPFGAVVK